MSVELFLPHTQNTLTFSSNEFWVRTFMDLYKSFKDKNPQHFKDLEIVLMFLEGYDQSDVVISLCEDAYYDFKSNDDKFQVISQMIRTHQQIFRPIDGDWLVRRKSLGSTD